MGICVLSVSPLRLTSSHEGREKLCSKSNHRKATLNNTENYIIRIYRRGVERAEGFAGLVIAVDTDEKRPFTSTNELLGILNIRGDAESVKNQKAKRAEEDRK